LPTPAHFEDAAGLIKKEDLASVMPLGPDPKRHLDEIQKMIDAGFDHIYLHQIGPDQEGFFNFYQKEIFPQLGI
jgi:coenzyme F420-dependent glucose-6-phosphate dehydrogenase